MSWRRKSSHQNCPAPWFSSFWFSKKFLSFFTQFLYKSSWRWTHFLVPRYVCKFGVVLLKNSILGKLLYPTYPFIYYMLTLPHFLFVMQKKRSNNFEENVCQYLIAVIFLSGFFLKIAVCVEWVGISRRVIITLITSWDTNRQ